MANGDKRRNGESNSSKSVRRIILGIVLFAILVYVAIMSFRLIVKPSNSVVIVNGKILSEDIATGVIIRTETIITNDDITKNGIEQIIGEGQKVAKGEPVLRYYTSNEDSIKEKIKAKDEEISLALEKEKITTYSGDIKILEDQIMEKLNQMYKFNDVKKITEYKKDINTYMNKKTKIVGEKSPEGSNLKKLLAERETLEEELNQDSNYIDSPMSGIVSYRVDGLEDTLTTDKFESLTKKQLEDIEIRTGEIVGANPEKGKIVDNFTCYIACILKKDKLDSIKVGDDLKIRLSNSEETTAEIQYISKDEGIVVLKISKYVEELVNYRKISLNIIWWDEEGLKAPNSAIKHEITGLGKDIAYVIRNRVGYDDKIYVKIKRQSDKYSIIENYTVTELIDLGVDPKIARNKREINMYDSILVD